MHKWYLLTEFLIWIDYFGYWAEVSEEEKVKFVSYKLKEWHGQMVGLHTRW